MYKALLLNPKTIVKTIIVLLTKIMMMISFFTLTTKIIKISRTKKGKMATTTFKGSWIFSITENTKIPLRLLIPWKKIKLIIVTLP
jgi:hypothetical protein